ncbi:MAG: hypothetical protein QOE58_707 [Actinomycetota bacterium]|jgi:NAD(P)-dependent dehydrogenase (short-subunit alcohol dehydrogenase family)|nr:hypothetical protein [Actinomycetota bacterium]
MALCPGREKVWAVPAHVLNDRSGGVSMSNPRPSANDRRSLVNAYDEHLAGGVAVVIGGAGTGAGLGAGLVREFARAGMRVAIVDLDHEAALRLATELQANGSPAIALQANITDASQMAQAAATVRQHFGSCNILCVHVGGGGQGKFEEVSTDALRETLELNVIGPVGAIQAFLPLMRGSAGVRRIVLTSSAAALAPGRFQGSYRAAKSAITSVGETLDLELGPEGIGTTIAFPSGMLPAGMLKGIALPEVSDDEATAADSQDIGMAIYAEMASRATDLASGEDAAKPVVLAVARGHRYVVTHGESVLRNHRAKAELLEAALEDLRARGGKPLIAESIA